MCRVVRIATSKQLSHRSPCMIAANSATTEEFESTPPSLAVSPAPRFSMSVIAFHEKAGQCQERFFIQSLILPELGPPLPPSFHPHSLVSDVRSVPVGRSRFSRCCHLIIGLSSIFRWKLGQAIVAVTETRRSKLGS